MLRTVKRASLGIAFLFALLAVSPSGAQDLLEIMHSELMRNYTTLREKGEVKSYYLSYEVTDVRNFVVDASLGALRVSDSGRHRILDTSIRVGDAQFDNYHRARGGMPRFTSGSALPQEDSAPPITRILWRDTDRAYRAAVERLTLLKSTKEVKVEEKDRSPDFSSAPVVQDVQPLATQALDRSAWEPRVRKWSALFEGSAASLLRGSALPPAPTTAISRIATERASATAAPSRVW